MKTKKKIVKGIENKQKNHRIQELEFINKISKNNQECINIKKKNLVS